MSTGWVRIPLRNPPRSHFPHPQEPERCPPWRRSHPGRHPVRSLPVDVYFYGRTASRTRGTAQNFRKSPARTDKVRGSARSADELASRTAEFAGTHGSRVTRVTSGTLGSVHNRRVTTRRAPPSGPTPAGGPARRRRR